MKRAFCALAALFLVLVLSPGARCAGEEMYDAPLDALRRELQIKSLPRRAKLALIRGEQNEKNNGRKEIDGRTDKNATIQLTGQIW